MRRISSCEPAGPGWISWARRGALERVRTRRTEANRRIEDRAMGVSPRKRSVTNTMCFDFTHTMGCDLGMGRCPSKEGCCDGNDFANGADYGSGCIDIFGDLVDGIFDFFERCIGVFDLWLEGEQGGGVRVELGLVEFGDDVIDGF